MKKLLIIFCVLTVFFPVALNAGWVSGLKSWTTEVLTPDDLNGVVNNLNNGITSAQIAAIDSVDARRPTSYPLFWAHAFADSTATNDSLTVEITKKSLIGTKQSVFIDNQQGVAETITLIIDGFLENAYATLDSVNFYVWTETVDSTDYVTVTAYDDSSAGYFKGTAAATAATLCSSTARTKLMRSLTGISITGGTFRLAFTVQTESDSMYVGEVTAYVSHP